VKWLLYLLEIREQLLRRLRVACGITERLQRRYARFPLAHNIEDIILLRHMNMERFTPHIEICKVKMRILIIIRTKISIKQRLVFLRQGMKFDLSHLPFGILKVLLTVSL